MSQQGWSRGPHSGQQDDWWSQLYDPGSPDTGRSRSGDTLDDRYASVRRTMGPTTAPGRSQTPRPGRREGRSAPEPVRREDSVRREDPVRDDDAVREGGSAPGDERPVDPPVDPRADGGPLSQQSAPAAPPDSAAPVEAAAEVEAQAAQDADHTDHFDRTGTAAAVLAEQPEVPLRPRHVGERPPTYEAEPATFPAAEPSSLSELVPDTVLDGAHYGGLTLRAASLRGDSARHRGALRRDALLTARFGSGESALLLVAVAAGGRAATGGHRAAREICHSIGGAVGRSHVRLAEDIRADRRGDLKSGLQRLTDRCYGKLRAQAAALEMEPEEYTADLRCLLLSADPRCRTRVFFGAGAGGVFRLRSGEWHDIENGPRTQDDGSPGQGYGPGTDPAVNELDASELGDPAALSIPVRKRSGTDRAQQPDETLRFGVPRPPGRPYAGTSGPAPSGPVPSGRVASGSVTSGPASSGPRTVADPASAAAPPPVPPPARPEPEPFRFCAAVARSGDRLLLCSPGLAEPLRAEPAFAGRLAQSWSEGDEPPGLAAFLADVQLRVRGFADDRTAVAVWEGRG